MVKSLRRKYSSKKTPKKTPKKSTQKQIKKSKRRSRKSIFSKRKSGKKYIKKSKSIRYQVAVEYDSIPDFKKSKYAKVYIFLELVQDEDDLGNKFYFYLMRLKSKNKSNLLKYLNDIGELRQILEIDENVP